MAKPKQREPSLMETYVSERIRELRAARGWSQSRLAEAADMSQPAIAYLESPNGYVPNLRTLMRVANAFDMDLVVRFEPREEAAPDA